MTITREVIYKNIDQIMANAEKVSAREELSIEELLNDDFLASETRFKSLTEMFSLLGKTEVSETAFNEISDEEWNRLIASETEFSDWNEMFTSATSHYIRKNVFSGIL